MGASGVMPCPRLNTRGPPPSVSTIRATPSSKALPPDTSLIGSRLPCTAPSACNRAACFKGTVQSRPSAVTPVLLPETVVERSGPLWKTYDRNIGIHRAYLINDPLHRPNAKSLERLLVKHARPGIEDLNRICPRRNLTDQIAGRKIRQDVEQCGKSLGMPESQRAAPAPGQA